VSDSLRAKAGRLLGQDRVTLVEVTTDGRVAAVVRSDVQVHRVTRSGGQWYCGCRPEGVCSHVLAVSMVAGGRP
jgi:hypothetical protein